MENSLYCYVTNRTILCFRKSCSSKSDYNVRKKNMKEHTYEMNKQFCNEKKNNCHIEEHQHNGLSHLNMRT